MGEQPKLTRLQGAFLNIIDFVFKGEIIDIHVESYDGGMRKAVIKWRKGDDLDKQRRLKERVAEEEK